MAEIPIKDSKLLLELQVNSRLEWFNTGAEEGEHWYNDAPAVTFVDYAHDIIAVEFYNCSMTTSWQDLDHQFIRELKRGNYTLIKGDV
jgi:hypothetical protein